MEPGKRHRLVRRLAKAAVHAAELVRLTGTRCDTRTQVRGAEAFSPLFLDRGW